MGNLIRFKSFDINTPEGRRRKRIAVVAIDPAGSLVDKAMLFAASVGRTEDVLWIDLADLSKTIGIDWMTRSTAEDPLTRRTENELQRDLHIERLLTLREKQTTSAAPLTHEFLVLTLDCFVNQDLDQEPFSELLLLDIYDPGSHGQNEILKRLKGRPDLARRLLAVNAMPERIRRENVGAASRLLRDFYGRIHVVAFTGETIDLGKWLDDGKTIFIRSAGVSNDVAKIMEMAILQKIIQHCRKGCESYVVCVIDESQKRINLTISQQLKESAKWGVCLILGLQNPLDISTPDIRNEVFGNSYHVWGRQGSPDAAAFAANDIGTLRLDPLKIHHLETRIRTIENETPIVIETQSVTKGKDKKESKTKSQHLHWTREDKEYDVAHYHAYNDQLKDTMKELMSLDPGWFNIRDEKVTDKPFYEAMMPVPWEKFPKYQKTKLAEAIAVATSKPWYRVPRILEASKWTPPNNPPTSLLV